ncbi:esterase/lipase [Plenodomus tracheiphilus IPT5]|uniref:Esterase/lipase n=1 Tax=Plenodomus tracheiphilus IPT5 TaxID=1408161 RepID=A0A6A7ANP1_9PLEO|nr:esterase/lipase [Plenodomus tracheiphilus IPT5]
MTSNPPSTCCTKGFKHEGQSRGRMENLGDFEAYVVEPASDAASNDYGVVYLTDVIGHKLINAQLLVDQYADDGYVCLMPDIFDGDGVPLNYDHATFSFEKWTLGEFGAKKTPHTPPVIDPIVDACIESLRTKYRCKKIALVGYCFGAKYVVRFLADPRVSAGFIAHPANIQKEELEAIKRPLALAAAETDYVFPANLRHESEETLKKTGVDYQINLYSGVSHGFAVRCDLKQRVQRFAKESAMHQSLQWLKHHLSE